MEPQEQSPEFGTTQVQQFPAELLSALFQQGDCAVTGARALRNLLPSQFNRLGNCETLEFEVKRLASWKMFVLLPILLPATLETAEINSEGLIPFLFPLPTASNPCLVRGHGEQNPWKHFFPQR